MEDFDLDRVLTPEEEEKVTQLSQEELALIDSTLLENVHIQWRKVSMIVGTTMSELSERKFGMPDSYYARRLYALVEDGTLESQGSLGRMRYSEVRHPSR